MRLKRILGCLTATSLAITSIAMSQVSVYASEFTFATDFIKDVITTSLTGFMTTMSDAEIATVLADITVDGNKVAYKGNTIGYWYSDDSTTLYKDDTKTDTVIKVEGEGYLVDPALLETLLTDVNNNIIENYVPTTDDWSKIVGKYDITLGNVTIPADQWISMETGSVGTVDESYNITKATGLRAPDISSLDGDTSLFAIAWAIDSTERLYISESLTGVYFDDAEGFRMKGFTDKYSGSATSHDFRLRMTGSSFMTSSVLETCKYVRASLKCSSTELVADIWFSDTTCSTYYGVTSNRSNLYAIDDPTVQMTASISDAKDKGIALFTGKQINAASLTDVHTEHGKFADSYSCSKKVIGNTTLTKRLAKVASLDPSDTLVVTPTSWIVSGLTNIDSYIAQQAMTDAGSTAEISAVAEIEPLNFNVVVPTTLPVYVAADGTVSVADNATVINKSNAAVKLTNIDIIAKEGSGWTLVDANPSDARDAREFTFKTSLVANTVLARDEVLPFTYISELSPTTEGENGLDLATVEVTVDWADI